VTHRSYAKPRRRTFWWSSRDVGDSFARMSIAERTLPWINDHALAVMAPERAALLRRARGTVVEIGFGSGLNVEAYGPDVREVIAVEPSDPMWSRGERRARARGLRVSRLNVFAESIPIAAQSVDVVVSTFVLCSVRDVDAAIAEARRILRPGGLLLAIEHVVSERRVVHAAQRVVRPLWQRLLAGCEPTRDLGAAIARAGWSDARVARATNAGLPFLVRELVVAECTA
jgi:SAM-dependent methyltransferase